MICHIINIHILFRLNIGDEGLLQLLRFLIVFRSSPSLMSSLFLSIKGHVHSHIYRCLGHPRGLFLSDF